MIVRHLIPLISAFACLHTWAFDLVSDYSGNSFFDGWDWFDSYDNLTHGDVWWLDSQDAHNQGLAYINNAQNAVIRVDNNTNVPYNQKRSTVRITTKQAYSVGSLWVADFVHIPYGCSVWPAFWTKGPLWPDDGEIDILEGINKMTANQYALHTTPGCTHAVPTNQLSINGGLDCATAAGCIVTEKTPNSYGPGFNNAGGGVWATQFDVAGVYIWFWSRSALPNSLKDPSLAEGGRLDISDWGVPSASYTSTTCDITKYFSPQNLVLDITLCGDWAGLGSIYQQTCGGDGSDSSCYLNNVIGPGSGRYDDAYFEISYIRAYTTFAPAPTPTLTTTTLASSTAAPSSSFITVIVSSSDTASATSSLPVSSATDTATDSSYFGESVIPRGSSTTALATPTSNLVNNGAGGLAISGAWTLTISTTVLLML